jgi:RHS repeat-associated protein
VQDRTTNNTVTVAPATYTTYDASGRAIKVQRLDSVTFTLTAATPGTDYVGPASQYKMMASTNGASLLTTTRTFYDDLGRVQYSLDARGALTENQYDDAGRRTNVLVYTNYAFTGTNDSTLSPAPSTPYSVTGYTFDANGNQTSITDALGNTVTNVYDAANRLVEVDYPATGTNGIRSHFTAYDGLGRKIQETDEAGVVTAYSYDFRGLLTSVIQDSGGPNSATTVYQYDEVGNQIAQTDALGRTTSFAYDALGRRVKRTLPDRQFETMGYDFAGNLLLHTNFNGVIVTNQYDIDNRLTNTFSINGYHVTYAYTPTGQRANMFYASGFTMYQYDSLNRLTNKAQLFTGVIGLLRLNYQYDNTGSLTNLWSSSPNGVNLAYAYDSLGRLTNVLANGNAAASYGFDLAGNLQSVHYGNGVTNLYQYDARNRLTNLLWNLNGSPKASFAYTLGPTGNRVALAETVNNAGNNYSWVYDRLYRLKGESITPVGTSSTSSLNYSYDLVGNRTNRHSTVSGLGNQAFSYTPNDWLSSDTSDANGNTIASASNTYQYDPLNRITNVNNGQVLIGYDGDGNRIKKTVVLNGTTTTTCYLVDDRNPSGYAQVVEEYQPIGLAQPSLSRVYNYGLSLISQREASGATYYFVSDGHGSTRMLMDTNGGFVNAFTYDAYGTLITSNGLSQTAYLYCGEQFDPDLGFYYLRARYYKPDTGRFWTMDTFEGDQEGPQSLHKYLFCADNPISNADPSGHEIEMAGAVDIGGMINAIKGVAGAAKSIISGGGKLGTGHTVVHIWHKRKSSAKGHASMTLQDGTHISWWPSGVLLKQMSALPEIFVAKANDPQTMDDDIKLEGQQPNENIVITTLNEAKIKAWWLVFKRTNHWISLTQNCSTTVADGLQVGGGSDSHSVWGFVCLEWASHCAVWTPAKASAYANAIKQYH